MNRKFTVSFFIAILIFVGLVGYNYQVAQRKIKETRPSPLIITLESFPETIIVGQTGTFIWSINSSPDLSSPRTTIYWGEIASPSALTQSDSPEAVGYPNHQTDYYQGQFKLPDTFDVSIKFDQVGKVFFRAYAKVGNNHLWTEEKSLLIIPAIPNVSQ
jgi:hypothetical protein